MSHRIGSTVCVNAKFGGSAARNDRVYMADEVDVTGDARDWDNTYVTMDMPAIGSTATDKSPLYQTEHWGFFVAPVPCRLIGLSFSVYFYGGPDVDSEGVRFYFLKATGTVDGAYDSDIGWKTLGSVDTQSWAGESQPGAVMSKGSATFSSSNGDISAGEICGFVYEGLPRDTTTTKNAGQMYGVLTATLRI